MPTFFGLNTTQKLSVNTKTKKPMTAKRRSYLSMFVTRLAVAQNSEVFQHLNLEGFRQMESCDGRYGRVREDPKYLVESANGKGTKRSGNENMTRSLCLNVFIVDRWRFDEISA